MSGASVTSRCTPRQKRRQKTPYEAALHHESRSLLFRERRNQCRYKHSKPCTDFMYCRYYILLFHLSTKADANVATGSGQIIYFRDSGIKDSKEHSYVPVHVSFFYTPIL